MSHIPTELSDRIDLLIKLLIGFVVVVIAIFVGTIEWLEHGRPRRFSLRTMLIVTAILAVALGLIIYGGGK
jgi:hypothetical protein